VLFIDTDDFHLYNNAFILRRRIPYKNGFPIGEPEIVFKFRHPELQTAAETDVRPSILGDHRVKFKVQALPLKEKLGGIRLLYSHNVQFTRGAIGLGRENINGMDALILYGATVCDCANSAGSVFKLTPSGTYTSLHDFTGGSDGKNPYCSVVFDATGNLYGTTYAGGSQSYGVVWEITP
jgi:uncharacterized repeat protein (TIGR03803 family)